MASLALAVVQRNPATDPGPALAGVPAQSRYLLRPPELAAEPVPADVRLLAVSCCDRLEAAAVVGRDCAADAIAVLEADECVSPELAAALVHLPGRGGSAAYGARRVLRFLGREIDGGTVVLAWRGHPAAAVTPELLAGVVVKTEGDIATTIARFDAAATRAAAERSAAGVADLVTRPVASLGRRLLRRRRDGVPGLILSVLETFGEMLAAAKAWERETTAARRRTRPSARRVPAGFVPVETAVGWAVVRGDISEELLPLLLEATPESVTGEPLVEGGRGAAWAITIGNHGRAVVRWYRRGGAVRRVARDRYFGWRPRPIAELAVTAEARRRGVASAEVLAARVDRLACGFYRGAIVTREVEHAEALAAALRRRESESERVAVLTAVARALRAMHDSGVHHRDLNANNVLVCCRGADGIAVHFIDFDGARIRRCVGTRTRRRALRRLERSFAKLAVAEPAALAGDCAALERAYWSTL
jgi:tRNA A-37 threonylcarbamoyl transferase component Bud32